MVNDHFFIQQSIGEDGGEWGNKITDNIKRWQRILLPPFYQPGFVGTSSKPD